VMGGKQRLDLVALQVVQQNTDQARNHRHAADQMQHVGQQNGRTLRYDVRIYAVRVLIHPLLRDAGGVTASFARTAPLRSGALLERERGGVDAVTQPRRLRAVGEHVPEMCAAARAAYFLAAAAEGKILVNADRLLPDRLIEARPAGAGIVLRLRAEKPLPADDAQIVAFGLVRVGLAGERPLASAFLRDAILLRREPALQLLAGDALLLHERTSFAPRSMLAHVAPALAQTRRDEPPPACEMLRSPRAGRRAALRGRSAVELDEQEVQALHERGRVLERTALRERGLLEKQQGKPLEAGVVLLALQPLDERMARVELEARRGLGRVGSGRLQQLAHLPAEILLADHESRGRLGQALAHAHLFHALPENALHALQQVLLLLGRLGLHAGLAAELLEIDRAASDVLQRLAAILVEKLHHPLVEPVRQQQHLDVAVLEDLEVRARARGRQRVRLQVVDHVLLGLRRIHVRRKAPVLLVAL